MHTVEHCGDFEIPTFLRAGHPDREAAIEKGAGLLSDSPRHRSKAKAKITLPKSGAGKGRVSQTTQDSNEWTRGQLLKLGYSKEFSETVGIKKAEAILEDIKAGRGAVREDINTAETAKGEA